jgi:hypothetical protein
MMPIEAASSTVKPKKRAPIKAVKNAELGGRSQKKAFGVRDQGAEVGHRADT